MGADAAVWAFVDGPHDVKEGACAVAARHGKQFTSVRRANGDPPREPIRVQQLPL